MKYMDRHNAMDILESFAARPDARRLRTASRAFAVAIAGPVAHLAERRSIFVGSRRQQAERLAAFLHKHLPAMRAWHENRSREVGKMLDSRGVNKIGRVCAAIAPRRPRMDDCAPRLPRL